MVHEPMAVGDYDDAIVWLWRFSRPENWMNGGLDEMPLEAKLVADVFWVAPERLLEDVRRIWRSSSYTQPAKPAPLRKVVR